MDYSGKSPLSQFHLAYSGRFELVSAYSRLFFGIFKNDFGCSGKPLLTQVSIVSMLCVTIVMLLALKLIQLTWARLTESQNLSEHFSLYQTLLIDFLSVSTNQKRT